MSRVAPSLKPGGRRPFRAVVGFDRHGLLLVSLYALAGFARPINPAWRWESKQLALALNKHLPAAKAVVGAGCVETKLEYSLDRKAVEGLCEHYGWLRPSKAVAP